MSERSFQTNSVEANLPQLLKERRGPGVIAPQRTARSNAARLSTEKQVEHFIGRWQDQLTGDFSFEKAAEWQSAKSKTGGQQAEVLRQVARFNQQKSKCSSAVFGFDTLVVADEDKQDGA